MHDSAGTPENSAGPGDGSDGGEEAARLICLRLLAAGPRTRAQLGEALRRRRVPEEIAAAVLDRFTEMKLIDDDAFAQAWVETRSRGRGLARSRLAAELRQRGVATDTVRAAVGTLGPRDEIAAARRLVAQRIPGTRGRPLPARLRRLVGMLARRGYPPGLAYQVVREALEQERRAGACPGAVAGSDASQGPGSIAGLGPGEDIGDAGEVCAGEDAGALSGGDVGEDWPAD